MKALRKIEDFFLKPASPVPLAVLRMGLGLVLIAQALLLRTSMESFLAGDGLIQGDLAAALADPGLPKISLLVHLLAPFHVTELTCIHGVCGTYLAALILLVIGFFPRPVAAICWFLHWMLLSTGQSTNYGVDIYAHVFLFYLIWFPSSLGGRPSSMARLGLRVTQLHLCITYLCSAVEKSTGIQWWNGELLWRALNLPVYQQFNMLWLAQYPWITKLAGWGSLLLEYGYCIFIWPKQTRKLWVAGIVGLHLGIAFFLGLTLFGVIMAVLTYAVFGFSGEVEETQLTPPIVFFDGVCNMCNSVVDFLIKRDRSKVLRYASLQGRSASKLLGPQNEQELSSIIFLDDNHRWKESTAMLKILFKLGRAWRLSEALFVFPRFFRDRVYRFIAQNRYRWFGKRTSCRIPNDEERGFFLQ